MTDKEINAAIAELRGWTFIECISPIDGKIKIELWRELNGKTTFAQIPNFCNDLNAMHEVLALLDTDDYGRYLNQLIFVTCGTQYMQNANHYRAVIEATAHQEAEAYLRMKGVWK